MNLNSDDLMLGLIGVAIGVSLIFAIAVLARRQRAKDNAEVGCIPRARKP